jgi:hypothetical protein
VAFAVCEDSGGLPAAELEAAAIGWRRIRANVCHAKNALRLRDFREIVPQTRFVRPGRRAPPRLAHRENVLCCDFLIGFRSHRVLSLRIMFSDTVFCIEIVPIGDFVMIGIHFVRFAWLHSFFSQVQIDLCLTRYHLKISDFFRGLCPEGETFPHLDVAEPKIPYVGCTESNNGFNN